MASSFPIRLGLEDAFEETTTSNNESMFEDEIMPAAASTAVPPSSQRSLNSRQFDPFAPPSTSPVLMPMNPDADADLLGGTTFIPKHASKATKDAKITDITYQDGDDLLAGFPPNPFNTKAGDENNADNFVDDEAGPGDASNGGFLSRIRNPFTRNAVPAASGETQEPTTDPSPSTQLVGGLDYGGNSLPHPEEVMPGSTRHFIEESDNESQSGLDDNGNSLPHPDEVMPGSTRDFIEEIDNESQGGLDDNGNSLPHPEEVPRLWGRSARNSLKAQEDEERVLLNETLRMSEHSASSHLSLDQQHRLIQALDEFGSESSLPNATPVNDNDNKNSSSSNLFLPGNGDEESAYGVPIVHPIEIDGFDDESKNSRYNLTRKERMKNMLIKHFSSPKSRRMCLLVTALFLIFLGLLIPLSYLARERRQRMVSPPLVTLAPTPAPTPDILCEDEIVLTDSDGKDLDLDADDFGGKPRFCLTTKDPIHFRFKRCRPASPLDWVGIFGEGSVFLDRLWENYVDGTYLCGGQPCPIDDPNNKKSDPPRAATMKAPPIKTPGYYRLFLVEDTPWPYDYSKYTPSFRVVEDEKFCPSGDDNATLAPTLSGTFSGTFSGTVSTTSGTTTTSTSGTTSTLRFGTVTPTQGSTDTFPV